MEEDSLPDRMKAVVLSGDDDDTIRPPRRKRKKTSPVDSNKHAYYRQLVAQVLVRYQEERSNDASMKRSLHICDNDRQTTRARSTNHHHSLQQPDNNNNDDDDLPSQKSAMITLKINEHDVLFGRRSVQRNHPGNLRLREMCCNLQADYRDSNRSQKTAMTWRIVHTIHARGGRFLKEDEEDVWREVSPEVAREKVAFTIRDLNVSECH
ncbi:hypothetical protein FisN_26Lh077 [Fistulifera solaris]|uniref:DUF6824 domain-containing protein n=1 Tax=Fistulifera solaris TaxID=1519565 RepID=A0A1Z5KCL4_FISSO|nr:hypothetical protein FisN_26Lh077 [Fistulifera solaris]|eukprot:GAX24009.1 hypothetical protein FisN_26Lh077 [Fistulifera solaris]